MMTALLLALASSAAPAAETREFRLFTVEIGGTKFWLPSTVVVRKGDKVKIQAVSQTGKGSAHGLVIDAFKIKEVVDDKGKAIEFTADQEGVFTIGCHLHPPHVSGQLVVLED
jgi:nitrosocyanin